MRKSDRLLVAFGHTLLFSLPVCSLDEKSEYEIVGFLFGLFALLGGQIGNLS